ncbi:hypothetical protein [Chryseolinea sp. H1M3-3]|uniref:hypothetical protein n=1 Tax=Chryseolinea sp. H1M3-3 TaxID=3034144 RepID=UPI0023EB1338|nr:hypothetical protein [Chryseolinea sp. H1M3-3]
MKKINIFILSAACIVGSAAYAQESSDLDTAQNPVRQGDPAVRQSPEEIRDNGLRDMVKISAREIPANLQNALKGDDYKGESKTFYKSKDGESYAVEIKDGNITQIYRFDKEGKPVNDKKNR